MRRRVELRVVVLGILVLLALKLTGCDTTDPPTPTSVVVSPTTVNLDAIGATQQLTAEVLDQNGEPMPDETITWSSDDEAVATVSTSGLVRAEGNGPTGVRATNTSSGLQASASVTVAQVVTQLVVVSGNGQTGEVGMPLPNPLVVRALDRLGQFVGSELVSFTVVLGNGSVDPTSATTASDGRASTVWTLGTTAGTDHQVDATHADVASPASFTATAVEPGVPANIEKQDGDGQTGLVGFAVNIPPSVLVTDGSGQPVSGVDVTFTVASGGGSVTGGDAVTNASGVATVGDWTLGSTPGSNTLDASVTDVGSVTFTATGTTAQYDIEVRFLSSVTMSQEQAFLDAAARWELLIFGDLSNIPVSVPDSTCGDNSPAINETIDDLLIFATIDSIDGPDGVLGQAGPCLVRTSNTLTVVGVMFFDSADVATLEGVGQFDEVILHEMGHVIGLGTLWGALGLLAGAGGSDPHFVGTRAIEAFDRVGGTGYTGGEKVPVHNEGGPGQRDAHWRESVFDNELMTPFLNSGPGVENPLSEVTTASFWDMGYLVNLDGSDAYSLPMTALRIAGGATVELVNDVLNLPIYVVDSGGRVVDVIPRR